MALQDYNLSIEWSPGVKMLIADHLSRSLNTENPETTDLHQGTFINQIEIETTPQLQNRAISS